MTNDEMKYKIIRMFIENVPELENVDISADTLLISSGYVDSFNIIQMISLFEKEFSIEIDLENINYEDFETVNSIIYKIILKGNTNV